MGVKKMKAEEYRKLSDKDLKKKLGDLNFNLMKSQSLLGTEKIKNKDVGVKGSAKQGMKTSLQKEIRKNIARIKTIIREREGETK